jgi:hypothetical protein
VFAPSDFHPPRPARPPFMQDRLIGALVLLACIILCLVVVIGMDAAVFVPYNATHAPTETWQARHTATPVATPHGAPLRSGTRTPIPGHMQQARDARQS